MIRSHRIAPVLSRICGDGVHSALLVTSDGDLLASYGAVGGSSEPQAAGAESSSTAGGTNGGDANHTIDHPPLSAVGALVAEVAGDYRRMGTELQLLDPASSRPPPPPSTPPSTPGSTPAAATPGGRGGGEAPSRRGNVPATLKCLIIELEMGLVGVSSAGSDCYVVAIADPKVEHGMLKARLTALAAYVQEALSQLAEQP